MSPRWQDMRLEDVPSDLRQYATKRPARNQVEAADCEHVIQLTCPRRECRHGWLYHWGPAEVCRSFRDHLQLCGRKQPAVKASPVEALEGWR